LCRACAGNAYYKSGARAPQREAQHGR
jgi:hypothetical protein